MNSLKAMALVFDLASLTDDLSVDELEAMRTLAEWLDGKVNAQSMSNGLIGSRYLEDLTRCGHHLHSNVDDSCPACKGSGFSWAPEIGWSNRAALYPRPEPKPKPPAHPTLWETT